MSISDVQNAQAFLTQLSSHDDSIVVAYFTANWCGACKLIAPQLEQIIASNPGVTFLKIDVDKNPDIATSQEIYLLPTFIAYRKSSEVFRVEGSNMNILESKIREEVDGESSDEAPKGLFELNKYILDKDCECLNELNSHPLVNAFSSDNNSFLQSDVDAQLIISITFKEAVKIHSFIIQGPPESGPKNIRLYKNQPKTLSFDEVANIFCVQEFEMSPLDLEKGNAIKLRYVRFQNIKNIQIFVEDNQSSTNKTQINYIGFFGRPSLLSTLPELAPHVTREIDELPSGSPKESEPKEDNEPADEAETPNEAKDENIVADPEMQPDERPDEDAAKAQNDSDPNNEKKTA